MEFLEKINKIKDKETEKLYKDLKNVNTKKEIEEIDFICIENINIFKKIIEEVKQSFKELEKFKKNEDFINIKKSYENICEDYDSFSILISKIIITSFNDLEINTYKENEIEKNFIKTRYDIINNVKEKIYFLYLYLVNFKKIENNHLSQKILINTIEMSTLKIIDNLSKKKIIIEKNVWINKKTAKFLEIYNLKKNFNLKLYSEKFKILKNLKNIDLNSEYLINASIFSMYKINKVSGKTGSQFIMGSKDFIEEINKIRLKIDINWVKLMYKEYCEENKLIEKEIENKYKKYKDELSKLIVEKNKEATSDISKKISIYYKAITFKKIIEKIENMEKNSFYLPFIIDFRGRIYKLSSISPTFFKEIRKCVSFNKEGEKKIEIEIKQIENKINKIILKYEKKIKKIKIFENSENINKKNKISIIWILISIGEIFKENIGDVVKIEDFIDFSIIKINNLEESIKIIKKEKKNDFIFHVEMLKEIKEKGKTNKLLSKDATASVYQHLVKILGAKNDDFYKYTNLSDEETWYDTYSMIIKKWKSENDPSLEEKELIDTFFTRNSLKKTMMTENYGCGKKKCWIYFRKHINVEDKEKEEKIKKIFLNFYKYLTKNFIFKKNSEEIINEIKKRKGLIENLTDNSRTDLMYKRNEFRRINTTYNKKRITLKKINIKEEYEEKDFWMEQFIISVRANLVHFLDSSVAREIIKRITCISIHDCFMVEPEKVSRLIAITNYVMNIDFVKMEINEEKKKFFSLFILL